jgi:hypothetical protein
MSGSVKDLGAVFRMDGTVSAEDAEAFWASLPEAAAIALRGVAPPIAYAWQKGARCAAYRPAGSTNAATIYQDGDGQFRSHLGSLIEADSLLEAMTAVDNRLREWGWLLDNGKVAK